MLHKFSSNSNCDYLLLCSATPITPAAGLGIGKVPGPGCMVVPGYWIVAEICAEEVVTIACHTYTTNSSHSLIALEILCCTSHLVPPPLASALAQS